MSERQQRWYNLLFRSYPIVILISDPSLVFLAIHYSRLPLAVSFFYQRWRRSDLVHFLVLVRSWNTGVLLEEVRGILFHHVSRVTTFFFVVPKSRACQSPCTKCAKSTKNCRWIWTINLARKFHGLDSSRQVQCGPLLLPISLKHGDFTCCSHGFRHTWNKNTAWKLKMPGSTVYCHFWACHSVFPYLEN